MVLQVKLTLHQFPNNIHYTPVDTSIGYKVTLIIDFNGFDKADWHIPNEPTCVLNFPTSKTPQFQL